MRLEEFLDTNSTLFADDFEIISIRLDHMDGGRDVFDDIKKDRSGGLPWMAILNGDGKEVTTSDGPDGNIGCPMQPEEIDHFVEMIRLSTDSSEEELGTVRTALNEYAEKVMAARK